MHDLNPESTPIRVLDVENLGWSAALVEIEGETVLLLDVTLTCDERMDLMLEAMACDY